MMQHHKYSLSDLESMLPWERDMYVNMLIRHLEEENEKIKNILHYGERQYVESVNTTAELQLKMAEQAYKEAYESGDSDKIVEANKALQQANLQAFQARNIKLAPLQEQKYDVQPEPEQRQQPVQTPKPDEKALSWQKRNPWFGQKRAMTAYAYGIHEELGETGIVIGSDRYYAELDKAIRERFPDEFEDSEKATPKQEVRKKPATVVAPATRSTWERFPASSGAGMWSWPTRTITPRSSTVACWPWASCVASATTTWDI